MAAGRRRTKKDDGRKQTVTLTKIVGGGQAIGTLESGKKVFVWGGLPEETVEFRITKKKSKFVEGVVTAVLTRSSERIEPVDQASYLSTSPWQIMDFAAEQRHKIKLIDDAFALHTVSLPHKTSLYTDDNQYSYRNKVEFSWYGSQNDEQDGEMERLKDGEKPQERLDLAFFRRGSKGKIPVEGTSLAREEINALARAIRDLLQSKSITARQLKTLSGSPYNGHLVSTVETVQYS